MAPKGTETRPTADRVRQATFNALESRGAVLGATVLDLFAGSGALGIEALSRGAAHVTFVDADRRAVDAVVANLAGTGIDDDPTRAEVVRAEAADYLATHSGPWDLVLLDPPYATDAASWIELLDAIDADMVVCESDREVDVGARWDVVRSARYGSTVVRVAVRRR